MSKNENNNYLKKKEHIYKSIPIVIFLTMLLITVVLLQKSYATSFVTEGTIPAEKFELNGLPQGLSIEDEWSFEIGEVTPEKFPSFKNQDYTFVNATVNNTPVVYLGIAKKENNEILYYYLTDTESEENVSATILSNDAKIVLNYAKDEFNINYNITGDTDGINIDSVFGANRQTTTVNQSYSFDVKIPAGYTAEIYRNGIDITQNGTAATNGHPLGTEPKYTKNDDDTITPVTSAGPSSLILENTYYDNDVTEERNIEVKLTRNKSPLMFDAHHWVATGYASRSWYSRSGAGWKLAIS